MDVNQIVWEFFQRHGGLPGATREDQLNCHYLEARVIDSMGIVEMVSELETTLGIRFEAEHLQSVEFQTAKGLMALIGKILAQPPS